jgi:tetratricopeptide (TPR) repeat protein
MFHKYFFHVLACTAVLLSVGIVASAQTAPLRGHVIIKNADGTTAPVADAVIDVFRTDVSAKYETKTGKKGDFVFAGLPFVGRYAIAASKAGAAPGFVPQVRVGQDIDYEIELSAGGDGKRLTLAEINSMGTAAPAAGNKPSAEEAAKQAEILKQNAEIAASNKRAESSNAIIDRTFKAGNEAYRANNYDAAIAAFNEGIAADPEHPGIPSLLTNKAAALRARGVDRYNTSVKLTDDAAKNAGIESSKKDWREAAEAASRAVTLLKAAPASTGPDAATAKQALYIALLGRAEGMRLFVVKVDQSKVEDGIAAYQEYIAAEVDPAKKTKAQNDLAQMLFDATAFDKALVEYRKILEANPDDLNAILRAGQSLFNIGAINNSDKAMYQEAANYLGQFIAKAPDSDPFKADAKSILEALKDQANVKPEKMATPARRTRRP